MGSSGDLQVTTRKGVATKSVFTYVSDTIVKLVSTSFGIVCSGKTVRIKAVVTNADQGIFYKWYRNGKLDSIGGNIYASHALRDGDSLWCVVSFSRAAGHKEWKSEVIKFDVNLSRKLKLRIQSSKGTLICKGTSVTFNAVVGNGDFAPVYQWKKNDRVVGDSSDTYVDDKLQNGDVITCTMIRAQECAVLAPTASLTMMVEYAKPAAPTLIIGPDEVSPSQQGIIFSVPAALGAISYKWQIPVGVTFTSENNSDSIMVGWGNTTGKISVGALNTCGVSSVITKTVQVTSNNARITTTVINKQITNEAASIIVYPNPANSKASVIYQENANTYNVLELRDANGKLLLHQKIQNQKGQIRADINTSTFAPGIYYILLIDKNNKAISKRLMMAK